MYSRCDVIAVETFHSNHIAIIIKLINPKLICAFCWFVLSSSMKMHGPKNKICSNEFNSARFRRQ